MAIVNNIPINARNWTHGSIQARMRYIKRLGRDPQVAARFDRTGRRVFIGLICITLVCAAVVITVKFTDNKWNRGCTQMNADKK